MAGKKTISQRISLEGGAEIIAQLKAMGSAGEKALEQIAAAARKADLDKFGASLGKVGSDLATVGRRFALIGAGLAAWSHGCRRGTVRLGKIQRRTGRPGGQIGRENGPAGRGLRQARLRPGRWRRAGDDVALLS